MRSRTVKKRKTKMVDVIGESDSETEPSKNKKQTVEKKEDDTKTLKTEPEETSSSRESSIEPPNTSAIMSRPRSSQLFTNDERLQLAKFYFEHFTVFNSPRYKITDCYVYPDGNLNKYLLDRWATQLSKPGKPKSVKEVLIRLKQMLREVEEYRLLNTDIESCCGLINNAAFSLMNHIGDVARMQHPKVEKWLDDYETHLAHTYEVERMQTLEREETKELSYLAKEHVKKVYKKNIAQYERSILRKNDIKERKQLLEKWTREICTRRECYRPKDVENFIYQFKKTSPHTDKDKRDIEEFRRKEKEKLMNELEEQNEYEEECDEEEEEKVEVEDKRRTSARGKKSENKNSNENDTRKVRWRRPKRRVICDSMFDLNAKTTGFLLFSARKRHSIADKYNEYNYDMNSNHIHIEWSKKTAARKKRYEEEERRINSARETKVRDLIEHELHIREEMTDNSAENTTFSITLYKAKQYQTRLLDLLPKFEFIQPPQPGPTNVIVNVGTGQTPNNDGELENQPSSSTSRPHSSVYSYHHRYRMNRPSMTRAERHLLGLLYRRHFMEFEGIGQPARTQLRKRKQDLLLRFAKTISLLGVSEREPDEISTKIQQHKSQIRYRKQYEQEGEGVLTSEFKTRQGARPLSPITRLFDMDDNEHQLVTDYDITSFINDCHESEKYHRQEPSEARMQGMTPEVVEFLTNFSGPGNSLQLDITNTISPTKTVLEHLADLAAQEKKKIENDEKSAQSAILVEPPPPETCNGTSATDIYETVQSHIRELELTGGQIVVYDMISENGSVTRMAFSREVSERGDVDYFMWSRFLEIDSVIPMTMFVCAKCEAMSQAQSLPSNRKTTVSMISPPCHFFTQQSIPALVVDEMNLAPVGLNWNRPAPRHKCVPMLSAALCEKFAEIAHILIRCQPSLHAPESPPKIENAN